MYRFVCYQPLPDFHRQKETAEASYVHFDRLYSENIKYVKGLSQNWIYAIHQDQYGYMWFGTWEGLNKYDGYNYTIYNVEDGLSDHTINCILEDSDGCLWLGTNKGLNKFDRKKQSFTQYTNFPGDTSNLFYNQVHSIVLSKNGIIWLGTGAGLYEFDKSLSNSNCIWVPVRNITAPEAITFCMLQRMIKAFYGCPPLMDW